MIECTANDVCAATGATLVCGTGEETLVGVAIDSRRVGERGLFVAFPGENVDGNDYVANAIATGAGVVAVTREVSPEVEHAALEAGCAIVRAADDDGTEFMLRLAEWWRARQDWCVVGVTGSVGKTTTKELVAAVLSEKYNVLYTQGNFNNDIGVPKTLLRLTPEHEIAVVEMGASHPGDIKTLVDIVEPDYGIITNVGRAHLQGFGSFEGVVKTKGELYDYLRTRTDSTVFIDNDNPHLMGIAQGLNLVRYSSETDAHTPYVYGKVTGCSPFLQFDWRHQDGALHHVDTHLIGAYNIKNMLAAATIGIFFAVSEQQVCHALETYVPSNNRSELMVTVHNRLIVDAYNANPTSMAAALDNFKALQADHKMCILGEMRELGEVSHDEHQKVVDMLRAAHFDEVWLVGDEFAAIKRTSRLFHNVDEVKAAISQQQPQGHTIRIKGSNSTKLFQLPELL